MQGITTPNLIPEGEGGGGYVNKYDPSGASVSSSGWATIYESGTCCAESIIYICVSIHWK